MGRHHKSEITHQYEVDISPGVVEIVDRVPIPVQVIARIVKPVLIISIIIMIIPIVPVIIFTEGEPGEQEQGRQNSC